MEDDDSENLRPKDQDQAQITQVFEGSSCVIHETILLVRCLSVAISLLTNSAACACQLRHR